MSETTRRRSKRVAKQPKHSIANAHSYPPSAVYGQSGISMKAAMRTALQKPQRINSRLNSRQQTDKQ